MSKETGGPAFPLPLGSETVEGQGGMTLRDYFAATAMQSLLENTNLSGYGEVSRHAYLVADRMLEAREKD